MSGAALRQVKVRAVGVSKETKTVYRVLRRSGWGRSEANFMTFGVALARRDGELLVSLPDGTTVAAEHNERAHSGDA